MPTIVQQVRGYALSSIEYKTITDFNDTMDTFKKITCVETVNHTILLEDIVKDELENEYWKDWRLVLSNRIKNKPLKDYSVEFIYPDIWA